MANVDIELLWKTRGSDLPRARAQKAVVLTLYNPSDYPFQWNSNRLFERLQWLMTTSWQAFWPQ